MENLNLRRLKYKTQLPGHWRGTKKIHGTDRPPLEMLVLAKPTW